MTEDNVLHLHTLTKEKARELLSDIASNHSERVIMLNHTRERMAQRGISDKQVFRCLKNGQFKDEPFWSFEHKNWQMTLETVSAGDSIGLAVSLGNDKRGNKIIVITAYTL